MKFSLLREFKGQAKDMGRYLTVELAMAIRELRQGLTLLNFNDNFKSFTVENLSIDAGETVKIRNLLAPQTPSARVVLRSNLSTICDGETWDQDFVSLKNTHATDTATVTVVFLK